MVQALVVTSGPFAGRICENDDDGFIYESDFEEWHLEWLEEAGVEWTTLEFDGGSGIPEDDPIWKERGVECEIVAFGRYMFCRGYYMIPHQFLRPATMKDLIDRYQSISQKVFHAAWVADAQDIDDADLKDLLLEQAFIRDEISERDLKVRFQGPERKIFLCHSSADKPFVRTVASDLTHAGHKVCLDEFEIAAGDSIVAKISEATDDADALIMFVSKMSVASEWVRREWQSTLARKLSGSNTRLIPALIEECELPALLSDIKYADFRSSYTSGLDSILVSLSK